MHINSDNNSTSDRGDEDDGRGWCRYKCQYQRHHLRFADERIRFLFLVRYFLWLCFFFRTLSRGEDPWAVGSSLDREYL